MFNDKNQSYSAFKNNFYARFPDLTFFDCGEINLLKVVLSGLRGSYSTRGKIRTNFLYNSFIFFFFKVLQQIKLVISVNNHSIAKNNPSVLVFNSGRITFDESENPVLFYHQNIINHYKRENCLVVVLTKKHKRLDVDYAYDSYLRFFTSRFLSGKERNVKEKLMNFFNKINNDSRFTLKEKGILNIRCKYFLTNTASLIYCL